MRVLLKTLALAAAASAVTAPVAWGVRSAHHVSTRDPCAAWSVRTLLSGQGWLENLAFEPDGSMSISALAQSKILRLRPSGAVSTLVAGVSFPGGGQVRRGFLYFNTGDVLPPAPTGTVDRLNLRTGKSSIWATGLTIPNGLAVLGNGDAIVTGHVPATTGVSLISASDPTHPHIGWAKIAYTNGIIADPTGHSVYVDQDPPANNHGPVYRIPVSDPQHVERVGELGPGTSPDDMTVDGAGILYIAGYGADKIYRLDPSTHRSCAIASGLQNPTLARFGGPGWRTDDLYVTSGQGYLYQLTPPPGASRAN